MDRGHRQDQRVLRCYQAEKENRAFVYLVDGYIVNILVKAIESTEGYRLQFLGAL